jgi:hypothetical protein
MIMVRQVGTGNGQAVGSNGLPAAWLATRQQRYPLGALCCSQVRLRGSSAKPITWLARDAG